VVQPCLLRAEERAAARTSTLPVLGAWAIKIALIKSHFWKVISQKVPSYKPPLRNDFHRFV
jgi:hypothetical protein